MKSLIRTLRAAPTLALAIASLLALGACTSAEEPPTNDVEAVDEAVADVQDEVADLKAEIEETATAAREFAYAEKDEFESWAGTRMETIEKELDTLQTRVASLDDDTKSHWRELQLELQKRRATVATEIDEAVSSGEEMWNDASSEAARSIEQLGESVSDALRELSRADQTTA